MYFKNDIMQKKYADGFKQIQTENISVCIPNNLSEPVFAQFENISIFASLFEKRVNR